MRTNTLVGTEEVVAIVLEDVANFPSTVKKIKTSIEAGGFGVHRNISRDFLLPTVDTATIMRGETVIKLKCCAVKLNRLPQQIHKQLKSGKPRNHISHTPNSSIFFGNACSDQSISITIYRDR